MRERGFTLIELIIAITIMAVISMLTAESIRTSIQNKGRIQKRLNRMGAIRDSLKIMEADIRKAFHHRDLNKEMIESINHKRLNPKTVDKKKTKKKVKLLKVPEYPNLTQFIGEKASLHFTNLNHVRTMLDSQESDQQEVGYFIKDCRSRGKTTKSSCLWRRISAYIDDDVTKGGDETVLVEHVTGFSLRYFGPGRDDWVEDWKSDERGDAISQNRFPYAVEVTLTLFNKEVKNGKEISMTMVAPIDFPNNKDEKKDESDSVSGSTSESSP